MAGLRFRLRQISRRFWFLPAVMTLVAFFATSLAIAGLATPLVAAVAMSGSSLLVILNALRAHRGARGFG